MQNTAASELWEVFNPLRLAGPIFDKELRVASRRGRTYLLRFGYIGVLSLVVLFEWQMVAGIRTANASPVVQVSQMGLVAPIVVGGITWLQFLMSQFLAVALLSGTVADEIRKRSLDALLVSPISSLQIVLGKLFGQLLQLVLLLVVSLPVLAVVRVFGGVPWNYVLASLCITLTAALVTGSLSLFLSIADRNAQTVIAGTICWCAVVWLVIPWLFSMLRSAGYIGPSTAQVALHLINPYYVLAGQSLTMVAPGSGPAAYMHQWPVHCLIMVGVSAAILALSVRRVRRAALAPVPGARERLGEGAAPTPGRLSRRSVRRIEGSPIVWREMKRPMLPRGRRGLAQGIMLAIAVAVTGGALIVLFLNTRGQHTGIYVVLTFLSAGVFVLNVTSCSAAAITREKEGRTLHVLLMTPCDDSSIVKDKAVGVLRRNLPLLIPIPLLSLLAYASTPTHPHTEDVVAAVLWFIFTLMGHTALLMGLGFCLGAYVRTTAVAIALTYAVFFAIKIFGFMLFMPLTMISRTGANGTVALVTYAGVQALVYAGIAWILGSAAAAGLRPNCQR